MVFLLLVSVLFRGPLTILLLVGSIGGRGGIKMVSASTPSANEPAKDLILVHTVQLKPDYKRIDVAIASVDSEKAS